MNPHQGGNEMITHHTHRKPQEGRIGMALSLPQREMLAQIGSYQFGYAPKEYNFKSKTRVCEKLVALGLAYHYPHGGFAITEAGKQLLSTPITPTTPTQRDTTKG